MKGGAGAANVREETSFFAYDVFRGGLWSVGWNDADPRQNLPSPGFQPLNGSWSPRPCAPDNTPPVAAVVGGNDDLYLQSEDDIAVFEVRTGDCSIVGGFAHPDVGENRSETEQIACDPVSFGQSVLWVRNSNVGDITAYLVPDAAAPSPPELAYLGSIPKAAGAQTQEVGPPVSAASSSAPTPTCRRARRGRCSPPRPPTAIRPSLACPRHFGGFSGVQPGPGGQPNGASEAAPGSSLQSEAQAQAQMQSQAQAQSSTQMQPGVMAQRQKRVQLARQEQGAGVQTTYQATPRRRAAIPVIWLAAALPILGFAVLPRRPALRQPGPLQGVAGATDPIRRRRNCRRP